MGNVQLCILMPLLLQSDCNMPADTSSNGVQPAAVQYSASAYACRGQPRQQRTGGKQIGVEEEKTAEGSGASSFNGVRAVPGVDGGTVYAAFLGGSLQWLGLHLCVSVLNAHMCSQVLV